MLSHICECARASGMNYVCYFRLVDEFGYLLNIVSKKNHISEDLYNEMFS